MCTTTVNDVFIRAVRRLAAADRMSASRRRRRRFRVMLYTSYMLLDYCNAVYNEA